MDSPKSPLSVPEIVAFCRRLSGCWLDYFKYNFIRNKWVFVAPNGATYPISQNDLPQIAAELGGWVKGRGVAT
jgi:hypothetical protein